jgi:hypothetical protein
MRSVASASTNAAPDRSSEAPMMPDAKMTMPMEDMTAPNPSSTAPLTCASDRPEAKATA